MTIQLGIGCSDFSLLWATGASLQMCIIYNNLLARSVLKMSAQWGTCSHDREGTVVRFCVRTLTVDLPQINLINDWV